MAQANALGVLILTGPQDWQIVQQDQKGMGTMVIAGQWISDVPGKVEVRLVQENTGITVTSALGWQQATVQDDTWTMRLTAIPAGGPYRLETRLNTERPTNYGFLDTRRGDGRHHLGVGDLWLIAGQSNASGSGQGPYADAPTLGVHVRRPSDRWDLATHPLNDATNSCHPAQRDSANPGHSPWLRFGTILHERLGYPIGLIPTALGGSPLREWNPTDHADPTDASLFQNMMQVIAAVGGQIKGVVWYQGEVEANPQEAPTYLRRFCAMVTAWRSSLDADELPIITAQLNRFLWTATEDEQKSWTLLREAQRQVPHHLLYLAVVPTSDLPLSDLIHNSPVANLALAQRYAAAALGMVYGQPMTYHAPDLREVHVVTTAADDMVIELQFDHVTSQLETIDVTTCPFQVQDAQGPVAINVVGYPGDATVHLHLARPLRGAVQVEGGVGLNPAPLPVDRDRGLPALAFSGVWNPRRNGTTN